MYVVKRVALIRLIIGTWKTLLGVAVVVVGITFVHVERFDLSLQVSMAVAAVGTAVSFFIAFFAAQAYDRWWEARKIWGEFVNDSRSWGRLVTTILPSAEDSPEIAQTRERLVRRHIAFLYAVKARLREQDPTESLALLSEADAERVHSTPHLGNALLKLQGEDVDAAERSGAVDVIRTMQLNEMLNRFSSAMGAAERIKLTVFPPYYPSMVQIAIWFYISVFALALSENIGYWSIPYVFLTGALFHLVFNTGMLLVDPFENHPNDIPMSSIVRTIEINLLDLLGEKDLPPPVAVQEGHYLM